MEFSGKKVVVLGLARSGLAAAELLRVRGAEVWISDQRAVGDLDAVLLEQAGQHGIRLESGGHSRSLIEGQDLVITSPGVRVDAPPLQWARQRGIPVWAEIELAARLCAVPIIAVTGSNGKTTVVTLISQVLARAGLRAGLCGNVGYPFCRQVLAAEPLDYIVLEVSSFQLETIAAFRPHIAVLLNVSQNHLDRHADLEEYFRAKQRLFINQTPEDFAVLNAADERVRGLAPGLTAAVRLFNTDEQRARWGLGNPNFLAVAAVAEILGIAAEVVGRVFAEFPGVEHRLERVRCLDGVTYVNDSKATTAESGRWALQSLSGPVILLCGGRDKNIDFSVLTELVRERVKRVVAFGEARDKFYATFGAVVAVERAGSLAEALDLARRCAVSGDTVVLSPMCASFDMFTNFEERGRVFKDLVRALS